MALLRGLEALEAGQFTLVLTQLRGRLDLSGEELAILGQAELALGHYPEAELHLLRPHLAGVARATVSYGAVLLQTGRVSAAKLHLEASVDRLDAHWEAEIRHLLAEVHLAEGANLTAAEQAEAAARLLLARDYEQRAATPLVTMAMACAQQGELFRAEAALMIALNILPDIPDPSARALALATLGWVQGVSGRMEMAAQSLQLSGRLNALGQQSEVQRKIAAIRADLCGWQMDWEGEHRAVDEIAVSLPAGEAVICGGPGCTSAAPAWPSGRGAGQMRSRA
ncbi:hypothetical protein ACFSC4_25905 [Deinococcus malanensis]|uniref:hypothetical protein n=1 Tax=Deinococcus malanensis TaxID=1706855 RepID=UPI00364292A8